MPNELAANLRNLDIGRYVNSDETWFLRQKFILPRQAVSE